MAMTDRSGGRVRPILHWARTDDDDAPESPRAAAHWPTDRPAGRHGNPQPHWVLRAQTAQALTLMPGQLYFGAEAASVCTLLGSCVAITLWHPQRRIGGMCHFLLPNRRRPAQEPEDGRFGNEALKAMVEAIHRHRTDPTDYHAHLYGGADTLSGACGVKFNIGERNIEEGWRLIDHFGFQLQDVDVGEDIPRTVTLHLPSGEVQMRRGKGHAPDTSKPGHQRSPLR